MRITSSGFFARIRNVTAVVAIAALALSGCSFGSSSGKSSAVGVPTFGKGVITAKGSVFVNGIEYDTNGTKITVNDGTGTDADLKVGMVVELKGSADSATGKGTAVELLYSADVDGPVGNVNAAAGTFTVFGRTVATDATTMWDGVADITGLAVGDRVEVSGTIDASTSSLKADRVYKKAASSEDYETKGVVSNLAAGSFTLTPPDGASPLTVNYTGTLAATIVDGSKVEVRFTSISGSVVTASAAKIHGESHIAADDKSEGEVSGRVVGYQPGPPAAFSVGGIAVSAAASLIPSGFADGTKVEVKGSMRGGVLVASSIKTEREANAELRGTVSSIAAGLDGFVANGVSVAVSATTRFRDENDASGAVPVEHFGPASLKVGDFVEARGVYDSSATPAFSAEKVVRTAPQANAVLQGSPSAVSAAALTLLGVPVDLSSATFKDANGSAVASGSAFAALVTVGSTVVQVKGSFAAGTFAATSARIDD